MEQINNSVLIVEDEAPIADLLQMTLQDNYLSNYKLSIDKVGSCEQARFLMKNKNYDLVLLDWMLPGEQGIDFLRSVKNREAQQASFLMLTAKVDPESIVQGLESGAEDYVTKPFDFHVLKARVKNILSRRERQKELQNEMQNELQRQGRDQAAEQKKLNDPEKISLDGLAIDFARIEVSVNKESVHLTPSEFKLLGFLLKSQGRVLTRDQLIDMIQGQDVTVTGRTIDTHVFALRKKLGEWAEHIETIRGVGYRVLTEL